MSRQTEVLTAAQALERGARTPTLLATMSGELQLFAVCGGRPQRLQVDAPAGTVHDLLEALPGGVYSAMRTFQHERFLWLDEHIARTERSMAGLGWKRALDRAVLRRALHETAHAYPLADSRVRFDVLREPAELQGVRSDLFVALSPHVPVPEEFLRHGVRVEFAPHLHRDSPHIKTTEFVRRRKPFPIGSRERFEHLLLDEAGRILECSSANVAFVRGRELVAAGDGVLEGITLKVLLHLAPQLGLNVRGERLSVDALSKVDEAFLSSSARGVVPIVQVEEQRIGDGTVGPTVHSLMRAYEDFAAQHARPAID